MCLSLIGKYTKFYLSKLIKFKLGMTSKYVLLKYSCSKTRMSSFSSDFCSSKMPKNTNMHSIKSLKLLS